MAMTHILRNGVSTVLLLMAFHATTHAQTAQQQQAQAREAQARVLLAKYTASPGRDDTDGLLKEPAVRAELQRVVGNQLPKLMQNINVRGSVAFDGGGFMISGNAPHRQHPLPQRQAWQDVSGEMSGDLDPAPGVARRADAGRPSS
jgi:hypothetical protein